MNCWECRDPRQTAEEYATALEDEMTVSVQLLGATRALIVRSPSLVARIIYGARSSSDLAIRQGGIWCYTAPARGWVGLDIESEIDDALQAAAS